MPSRLVAVAAVMGLALAGARAFTREAPPPSTGGQPDSTAPRQQSTVRVEIFGEPGAQPRYAVPDFLPLSREAEVVEAARTIAQVLWDDLAFEREFYIIP